MNLQHMMKQAKELQKKMTDMQSGLDQLEVSGSAGGGMVKVIINAKYTVKKVNIDKSLLVPEDVEVLEDLIVAAFNNAKQNAELKTNEEMQKLGVSPDLMKMVF